MNFDFETFCNDYYLEIAPSSHSHYQKGWVNVVCPFCTGNSGYHLGFNIIGNIFHCWRCGRHSLVKTIKNLVNVTWIESKIISEQYRLRPIEAHRKVNKKLAEKIKMPLDCGKINSRHKKYLEGRNFDPDKLVKEWGILGTGAVGSYKHRVIFPIVYCKKVVSYQGRDITNKQKLRYKACEQKNEVVEHQNILYGYDEALKNNVVVVEGITDVLRLGYGAVSCFGVDFSWNQALLLLNFKNIFVMFDNDNAGNKASNKLGALLDGFGKNVEIINLSEGDPADLSDEQAKKLMKELKIV
jgi:5S rRNA maturation endonuclease (ribonuclease M5)